MLRSLVEPLEPRRLLAAVNVAVDFADRHQTIRGLGSAIGQENDAPEHAGGQLYDDLAYDLGATAVRVPIWPMFENANDNADPAVMNMSGFDSGALAPTMGFAQRMKERGATLFLGSVWTPPWWQKTTHTHEYGGHLRDDMRAEFAEYLAAYVIAARDDYGVELDAVTLQNEAFFVEWYESAYYTNVQLRETLIAVGERFEQEGLTTKIMLPEDLMGTWDTTRLKHLAEASLSDPQALRHLGGVAVHWTDPNLMEQQRADFAPYGKPIWYTEISGKDGTWTAGNGGGVGTALEALGALTRADAEAWFYWQYTDVPHKHTAALMGSGVPNGKYHALRHIYRWVRPGMERVTATSSSSTLMAGAFDRGSGGNQQSTIVLINDATEPADVTLDLSAGGPAASWRGWQSYKDAGGTFHGLEPLANTAGGAGTRTLVVPAKGIVTLHVGPDLAPHPNRQPGVIVPPVYNNDPVRFDGYFRNAMIGQPQWIAEALDVFGRGVNETSPRDGWAALHWAAAGTVGGGLAVIDLLLSRGANVNLASPEGVTPLHAAAMTTTTRFGVSNALPRQKVERLLVAGANPNALDSLGRTPLHWAALMPDLDWVSYHNPSVLEALLLAGADKAVVDDFGMTALDYARAEGVSNNIRTLLAGPDATAPRARWTDVEVERGYRIQLTLTEDVTASLTPSDFVLTNVGTGQSRALVPGEATIALTWNVTKVDVRLPLASLADGDWRLTLPAGSAPDPSGNANAAVVINFHALAGDLDRDRDVDFADLAAVAGHYGQTGRTRATGNADGDAAGTVSFADLALVAGNYGKSLDAARPAVAPLRALPRLATTRVAEDVFADERSGPLSRYSGRGLG